MYPEYASGLEQIKDVINNSNGEVVGPIDETKCLDCPVGMAWEAILEADAEAAMS